MGNRYDKYDVSVLGEQRKKLGKGRMMLFIISRALKNGVAPEEIEETIDKAKRKGRMPKRVFEVLTTRLIPKKFKRN